MMLGLFDLCVVPSTELRFQSNVVSPRLIAFRGLPNSTEEEQFLPPRPEANLIVLDRIKR
jgi:hypothetical protein